MAIAAQVARPIESPEVAYDQIRVVQILGNVSLNASQEKVFSGHAIIRVGRALPPAVEGGPARWEDDPQRAQATIPLPDFLAPAVRQQFPSAVEMEAAVLAVVAQYLAAHPVL